MQGATGKASIGDDARSNRIDGPRRDSSSDGWVADAQEVMARSSDRVARLESRVMNAAEAVRSSEGHMIRGNVEGAKDRSDAERLLARGTLRRVNALSGKDACAPASLDAGHS